MNERGAGLLLGLIIGAVAVILLIWQWDMEARRQADAFVCGYHGTTTPCIIIRSTFTIVGPDGNLQGVIQ